MHKVHLLHRKLLVGCDVSIQKLLNKYIEYA
jgi:hypothetical protein